MAAAGVGIWAPGENPGTHDECARGRRSSRSKPAAATSTTSTRTARRRCTARSIAAATIAVIQFLADRGAKLDVVNAKGWTPVTVADGVEYTPDVLKRYPEAAALLR